MKAKPSLAGATRKAQPHLLFHPAVVQPRGGMRWGRPEALKPSIGVTRVIGDFALHQLRVKLRGVHPLLIAKPTSLGKPHCSAGKPITHIAPLSLCYFSIGI